MKKHGNIQMDMESVRWIFKKITKLQNDNIVINMFIICQKSRHVQVI
jgi:hypothetical protein